MKATDKKVDDAKKDAAKAKQEGDATASKVKAESDAQAKKVDEAAKDMKDKQNKEA